VVGVKRTTLEVGRVFNGLLTHRFRLADRHPFPVIILTILAVSPRFPRPIFFSRRDDGSPVYRIGEGGLPFRYSNSVP
jgi:hypothetical protein